MRLGDPEVGQQEGGCLGLHRSTAISVQRQLAGWHVMLGESLVKQGLEQGSIFRVGDTPANDAAAEDVEDDIQVEIRPFGRSHQLGDIPRPDLVGGFGQQLGLLVEGMAELVAPFTDLTVFGQDAIQGADRAKIDALVQQGGIDLRGGQIDEPGCSQKIEHTAAFFRSKRPRWREPGRA